MLSLAIIVSRNLGAGGFEILWRGGGINTALKGMVLNHACVWPESKCAWVAKTLFLKVFVAASVDC